MTFLRIILVKCCFPKISLFTLKNNEEKKNVKSTIHLKFVENAEGLSTSYKEGKTER